MLCEVPTLVKKPVEMVVNPDLYQVELVDNAAVAYITVVLPDGERLIVSGSFTQSHALATGHTLLQWLSAHIDWVREYEKSAPVAEDAVVGESDKL